MLGQGNVSCIERSPISLTALSNGSQSFHCLFCHGYEESGSERAGLLAVGMTANKNFAITIACMAKQLAKSVTIFTHGDLKVAEEIKSEAGSQNLNVDARQIARLEKVPGDTSAIRIHFEDGSEAEEIGFMAHGPRTRPTTPWHEQLDLELTEMGDFKSTPPFGTTSVHGVFVAGDCSHMMKAVLPALSSGGMAAGGVAHQLSQGK